MGNYTPGDGPSIGLRRDVVLVDDGVRNAVSVLAGLSKSIGVASAEALNDVRDCLNRKPMHERRHGQLELSRLRLDILAGKAGRCRDQVPRISAVVLANIHC